MNIYLDIDGTLIHEDMNERNGQPAAGLEAFLTAIQTHNLFWLTTHCRDGNPDRAIKLLKSVTDVHVHPVINRVQGTVWDIAKTQGLDFTHDFIWFDNEILSSEQEDLKRCNENQLVIQIDLKHNPNQLQEIVADLL